MTSVLCNSERISYRCDKWSQFLLDVCKRYTKLIPILVHLHITPSKQTQNQQSSSKTTSLELVVKRKVPARGKTSGQFRIIDEILIWFLSDKKLDSENALERKRLPAWMGGLIFWRKWRFAMRSISYLNFRTLLSWWFQTTLLKMLVKIELPQR